MNLDSVLASLSVAINMSMYISPPTAVSAKIVSVLVGCEIIYRMAPIAAAERTYFAVVFQGIWILARVPRPRKQERGEHSCLNS